MVMALEADAEMVRRADSTLVRVAVLDAVKLNVLGNAFCVASVAVLGAEAEMVRLPDNVRETVAALAAVKFSVRLAASTLERSRELDAVAVTVWLNVVLPATSTSSMSNQPEALAVSSNQPPATCVPSNARLTATS